MTDKKEHPHAWVLRAIADGEPREPNRIAAQVRAAIKETK
jgi:hypothetical protein